LPVGQRPERRRAPKLDVRSVEKAPRRPVQIVGHAPVDAVGGQPCRIKRAPRPQPVTPPSPAACQGFHVSDGLWICSASVVAQGDRLVLERYRTLRRRDGFRRLESSEAVPRNR